MQLYPHNMESQGRTTLAKGMAGGKGKQLRYSSFNPGGKQNGQSHQQSLSLAGNNMKNGGASVAKKSCKKSAKAADLGAKPNVVRDQPLNAKPKDPDDVKQRQAKFGAMLAGELTDLPAKPKSMVRIFLSSTFSDMRAERNTLVRNVYPVLKEYCASLDLDFQVVDMRWGVTEDSQNDHSVEELCLREITNCQHLSLGPNFVCILGDRYGFQLIPSKIASSEFRDLQKEAESIAKNKADLLAKWYLEDTNSVPPQHVLQPIRSQYPHYGDHGAGKEEVSAKHWEEWCAVLKQLRQTLRSAAESLHKAGKMSAERLQQFHWSVTESEINSGVITAEDPKSHALFFHRELRGITKAVADDEVFKFMDCINEGGEISVDSDARKKLHNMARNEIPKVLGKTNSFHFSLPWRGGGVDSSKCKEHSVYIVNFCKNFTEKITEMIDEGYEQRQGFIKSSEYYSEPDEIIHHLQFCVAKCASFCGRKDTLESVRSYVLEQTSRKPLIIYAESGAGKTSVMAFIMKSLNEWFGKPCIGVIRFLGTSPGTINLYDVLFSVCGQLADGTGVIMEPVGYQNFASLVQYMPRFLRRVATAAKVPIVILLDSVDQLSSANSAYLMKWLPLVLPRNVRLILSTLPQEHNILTNIKQRLSDSSCFLQVPLLQEGAVKEIVAKYLSSKHKTLTNDQLEIITEKFKLDPCPLYLKLLLDQAALWHSYTQLPQMRLGDSARLAIHLLFEGLEKKFGRTFIQTALGFITISLNGITEIEMEDVLSCDDEVLDDIYQFHDPPVEGIVRIPPLLWARVYHDLKEYLVERLSQGKTTMFWYHRQFIEVAKERFLTGDNETLLHKKMLEIFLSDSGVQRSITLTKRDKTVPDADRQVTPQPMIVKNKRKLECITHHLIHAKSKVSMETAKERVFCNYDFLTTKISAFSVQHVVAEMDKFLAERPDNEIQALRDFMHKSVADLRYPMHLAVHLLAGIANPGGCEFLESMLTRARFCVYNHAKPLLIPEGPCFAPRELSDTALTHCIVGCKEIISVSGSYLCTQEEGIEDGEPVCAVFNIRTGDHNVLEQIKLKDYLVSPVLIGEDLCMVKQDSLTSYNITTGKLTIADMISVPYVEGHKQCVLSKAGKLVGLLDPSGLCHVWDLTQRTCVERIGMDDCSNIGNICVVNDGNRRLVTTGTLRKPINDHSGIILSKSFNEDKDEIVHTQQPVDSISLRTVPNAPYLVGVSNGDTKCPELNFVSLAPLQLIKTIKFTCRIQAVECLVSVRGPLACVATDASGVQLYALDTGEKMVSFYLEEAQPVSVLATQVIVGKIPTVAIGGGNGSITFHNLENGVQLGQVKAFDSPVKGIILEENNLVAYAESSQLKVWDFEKFVQLVLPGTLSKPVHDHAGIILSKSFSEDKDEIVHKQQSVVSLGLRTVPNVPYLVGVSNSETNSPDLNFVSVDSVKVIKTIKFACRIKALECFMSVHGPLACVVTDTSGVQLYALDTGEKVVSFYLEEGQSVSLPVLATQIIVGKIPAVAIGGGNGNITFHNLETGVQLGQVKALNSPVKGIILEENNLVAYTKSSQLKVYDFEKFLQLGGMIVNANDRSLYDEIATTTAVVSLCSSRLYTSTKQKSICVWDIDTGKLMNLFPCHMVASDLKICRGESELLVVFSKESELLKVFHPDTGKEAIANMPANVLAVTLSKDLSTLYVVTHAEGRLKLHKFELPRFRLARSFLLQKGLNFKSVDAILSRTERYLVLVVECTANDRKSIEAQWKKGGFAPQPHPYRFTAIDLTHTSGTLLHCYRQLSKIPALGTAMIAHTGNTMIFCVRRSVCFWDIPTGRCDQMITKSGRQGMFYNPSWLGGGDNDVTAYATNIAQSNDGNFVVMGSDDGYVTTYRASNGAPIGMQAPLTKHYAPVKNVVLSGDSKWVISVCQKSVLKLWESQSAKEHFSLPLDEKDGFPPLFHHVPPHRDNLPKTSSKPPHPVTLY